MDRHRKRLEAMIAEGSNWDLSFWDIEAIKWALEVQREARGILPWLPAVEAHCIPANNLRVSLGVLERNV